MNYDRSGYDIGRIDPHWADAQIVRMIGDNKSVLELGCATGYIGKYLKEAKNCRLTGIEIDPQAAEKAKPYYEQILVGDLSKLDLNGSLRGKFDVILASNVLEHLIDPKETLETLKKFLAPGGLVIVALPNVAHWSVRLQLFFGNFNYAETGILDKTHLKFFTLKTARELIESAGLKVEEWSFDWDNGIPKLNGLLQRVPILGPALLKALYSMNPRLFGYQFIFKARA